MNFQDFQASALRTECVSTTLNYGQKDLQLLLQLLVAAAKIADIAKKTIVYSKPVDIAKMSTLLTALSNTAQMICVTLDDPMGNRDHLHPVNLRILHGSIGMFGEAGELLEAIAKQQTTGVLDMVNIGEECADSDWYKAILLDEAGLDEGETRQRVIAKLAIRYPEKFSLEQAENRDLAAERLALEGK